MSKHKIPSPLIKATSSAKSSSSFYLFFSDQRFLAILCLSFLILIIFPLAKTYTQKKITEKEIEEIQREIETYQRDDKEAKEIINYLGSDQSFIEQARLNMNMKKPGESVVVIDYHLDGSISLSEDLEFNDESNFMKWWRYFFAN